MKVLDGRRVRALGLVMTLTFAIAACGDDDESSSATTGAEAAPDTTPTASTGAETTDSATSPPEATEPTEPPAPSTEAPAEMAVPDSITVSIAGGIQSVHAVYFAALTGALGKLAADHGVEVETFNAGSGADAIAALAGGSADMCMCGASRALAAVEAGEDLVTVFNPFVGLGTVLVGAKQYEDTIGQDVAGYADKTWAYASEGGVNAQGAQAAAESVGLTWDSVNRITFGDVAAGIPTLESGQADLMSFDSVNAANAIALDLGYLVANLLDPNNGLVDVSNVSSNGFWMSAEFVNEYPDFTQAIVTALVETKAALEAAPDSAAVLAMMPDDFQEAFTDAALWDAQWTLVAPSINETDGSYSPELIEGTLDVALTSEAITEITDDLRARFQNEYLDQAYESLGIPRP